MRNPIIYLNAKQQPKHGSKASHIMNKKQGINFVHIYQERIKQTTCMYI